MTAITMQTLFFTVLNMYHVVIAGESIGAYAPKCYPGTLFCLLVCFFFLSFFEDGLEEVNMMDTVIILGITSKCRGYAEPIISEEKGIRIFWNDYGTTRICVYQTRTPKISSLSHAEEHLEVTGRGEEWERDRVRERGCLSKLWQMTAGRSFVLCDLCWCCSRSYLTRCNTLTRAVMSCCYRYIP